MKTTLKISTLEDDRESSNSKSLLFKQTDNQELLELIYTNQHAFLKQPKFNKNSKIHILSPRNSIYSIKELENFDKINNNIDISLTSNDISQKHISFNKSYDGLNISCDRKKEILKKSKTLSVDPKKIKKYDDAIANKYNFSFLKIN